jgi:predicted ATPase/class 3 adenylate cyclase
LFTDIEGSTRLAQQGPDHWERLRKRHDDILRSGVDGHGGYVFHVVGDGCCAAFHTGADALNAAIDIQRKLQIEPWGEQPVKVRMGIHTGKAELGEDGDYRGYLAMSRVQRMMSAGHGGQVLLSRAVQEMVREELPAGVALRDLGEHRLKDLVHPERIFQADIEGLACDFPPLKTLNNELNNLPSQLTPFVGRERELAAVISLLRNSHVRLVTLTGAGGTGKTRLSLQAAAELLDDFEHGVWFVELDTLSDPDLVLPQIAAVLKIRAGAEKSIEQILQEELHNKQLLLVLDNFEQVVRAAPRIAALLGAAPTIKMLVSSREVLRLRGEHDYPVPPMGLPEIKRRQTAAVLAQYEAIALFIQHAQAANPAFVLDEDNAATIAEICARLEGLPLALELAAARSRLLRPAAMLEKLQNRLETLTGGPRDVPARQRTIRGAIEWSYDLLDKAEQTLFSRLGIFNGGWTAQAAGAVCGTGLALDILSGLESLLDKSLVRQVEGSGGEPRFSMLETIREYAFERLSQGGELEAVQEAHASLVHGLLENVLAATSTPGEVKAFARLDDELDNLRSAVEWTLAKGRPEIAMKAGRLYQYWEQRTNYREPLRWLERALVMRCAVELVEKAYAFTGAGNLALTLNDLPKARQYFESALALFHETQDRAANRIFNNLGNIAWREKDFEKARRLYEQALTGTEPGTFSQAMVLNNLGSLARISGEWDKSRDYYLRALDACERVGAEAGISYSQWFLGNLALVQGKLDEAQERYEKCMRASWMEKNPLVSTATHGIVGYIFLLRGQLEAGRPLLAESLQAAAAYLENSPDPPNMAHILEGCARLELEAGSYERAAQLLGASWTQREFDDYPVTAAERPDYDLLVGAVQAAIGDQPYTQLFDRGKGMALKDAIHFAMEELGALTL